MTDVELTRQLRDHYLSLDAGSAGRVHMRVADALDHAPGSRRSWGGFVAGRRARFGGLLLAAVAVLAVASVPLWAGLTAGPAASATETLSGFGPGPSGTYNLAVANAEVFQAGMTKNGVDWAVFGRRLSISTDHGRTWRNGTLPTAHPGDLPGAGTVAVVDADHAWFLLSAGADPHFTVFHTADGGQTWQSTVLPVSIGGESPGTTTFWPGTLSFVDASVGFAFVETSDIGPWTILRTTDGGVSWKATGSAAHGWDAVAVDEETLWAPGRNDAGSGPVPLLQVSRDAGATWSDVPLPGLAAMGGDSLFVLNGPTGGVQFQGPSEGYLAVLQKTGASYATRYFGTGDGGRTWSQLATLSQPVTVAPVFRDAMRWYQPDMGRSAGSLGLGVTSDGGKTWTITAIEDNWLSANEIQAFWTVDGENEAALGATNAGGAAGRSLFLSWDGGSTWQPADFSAR
jgi:hypothetical protein